MINFMYILSQLKFKNVYFKDFLHSSHQYLIQYYFIQYHFWDVFNFDYRVPLSIKKASLTIRLMRRRMQTQGWPERARQLVTDLARFLETVVMPCLTAQISHNTVNFLSSLKDYCFDPVFFPPSCWGDLKVNDLHLIVYHKNSSSRPAFRQGHTGTLFRNK